MALPPVDNAALSIDELLRASTSSAAINAPSRALYAFVQLTGALHVRPERRKRTMNSTIVVVLCSSTQWSA